MVQYKPCWYLSSCCSDSLGGMTTDVAYPITKSLPLFNIKQLLSLRRYSEAGYSNQLTNPKWVFRDAKIPLQIPKTILRYSTSPWLWPWTLWFGFHDVTPCFSDLSCILHKHWNWIIFLAKATMYHKSRLTTPTQIRICRDRIHVGTPIYDHINNG